MKTGCEADFLRTYKDFIYYFNMLERNIGYCLRHCCSKTGSSNPKKWIEESFDRKIKKLMRLVEQYALKEEFQEWHKKIVDSRGFRNVIAHGQWEWIEWIDKPIRYHAPELSDQKGEFTVREFQSKPESLKHLLAEFDELRNPLELAIEKSAQPDGGHNSDRLRLSPS